MKKVLACFLVLCLSVALFTGCDYAPDPQQVAEAIKNTQALDSLRAKGQICVHSNWSHSDLINTTTFTTERLHTDNPIAKMEFEDMFGEHYDIYADTKYCYNGLFGYYQESVDAINSRDFMDIPMSLLQELPAELLENAASSEKTKEGAHFNYMPSPEVFAEVYKELIARYLDYEFQFPIPKEYTIIDPIVSITIANNYVSRIHVSFDFETPSARSGYYLEFSIEYIDPGTAVQVIPPEGYDFFSDPVS